MKRVVLFLALVAACACAGNSERRLTTTFEDAKLSLQRGELAEARAVAERGLALTTPDSTWAWRFRFLRGEILLLQHQPTEVLPLVGAPLPEGPAFDPLRARQKYLEALVQRSQNRFVEALATLEAARRIAPDVRDVQLDVAWLDGQLSMRLGKWADAESTLNDVVAKAAAAGDRFKEMRALNDLGMGAIVRGRWDEALPWFERVLSFRDLESTTAYSAALSNTGICYSRLGEFERALAIQRQSVRIHTTRGTRADYAQALAGLGNTFILQGDARQGLSFMRQALAVAKESNLQADAALWAGNVASANIDLGDWDEATRFNEEAQTLKKSSHTGNLVHNTLSAAQIAQGRGRLDDAERLFEEALAGAASDPSVRWSAHAGLAGVAVARSQPDRASQHFEAALDTIEKTRSELLKTDYKLTFLRRLILFYRAYVDALVDQGRLERALELSESSRGRVLAERNGLAAPTKATVATMQRAAAQSRTVLVSYWLAPTRSYAWVVTATGVHSARLPPAQEIEALVRQFQSVIDNGLADPLAASGTAGDALHRLLVEPLLPWIPAGTHVIVAPDGALHGLNFETLPVATPARHYWIEDVEIEITPALSMLAAASKVPVQAPSLLLFGDPAPRPPEFPALKYAAAEIANVSKHFSAERVVSYEGSRASPAAYRKVPLDRFAFLHFTAHASANFESPLDSAVILAGPDEAYKLYARDVADTPLRAELVTVSACRSAGARAYSGEGLVGFAWAFLRAGANRVIAGLWDVDDRSTAELMDRLYDRLAAGMRPSQALRESKRSMIAKGGAYAKPYYWGPFELFTVVP